MRGARWYTAGLDHVWLPYAQMKTARPPLAGRRAPHGSRIVLADGRELIDGIASWWTACHGYNHPHIRAAVERQLATMPHVMFGGLVHEQALTLARRLAALLPGDLDRVFFCEFRLGRGRGRAEDGGAVLAQSRRARAHAFRRLQRRLSRRHHRRDGGLRSGRGHARGCSAGCCPQQITLDLPATRRATAAFARCSRSGTPTRSPAIIVEPLVQGAGGMRFHDAAGAAAPARRRRPLRPAADLR